MQIKLILHPVCMLVMPLNYNHAIQSCIYYLLSDRLEYSDFIHNIGYAVNKDQFRLFTFGNIRGNYTISDKKMKIEGDLILEIRSASDDFIFVLKNALLKTDYLQIADAKFIVKLIEVTERKISAENLEVKMLSPIVARTNFDNGKSVFYNPSDEQFLPIIQQNLKNKFFSFYHCYPKGEFFIEAIGNSKKVVTSYKDYWINAYLGRFKLFGSPEILDFLYQTGIGQRNSQGFGMFEILK